MQNRIKRNPVLTSVEPQCNVKNLDMAKLLSGKSTIELFMSTFPQLVGRIIIKYMQAYSKFKHNIVRHIPHQYSEEMSKESKMVREKEFFEKIFCLSG